MTNEKFCHIYTQFFGERIDKIEQIASHTFNGEELKEFVEFAIKQEQSETAEKIKALHQIENLMERWHHARDNDSETLQKINDELVGVGLLKWFNKETPPNPEKRDQFGVIAETDKEIVCELCVYFRRDNYNIQICDHCVDHNKPNEYYISK